jgi:hypothetical protein
LVNLSGGGASIMAIKANASTWQWM